MVDTNRRQRRQQQQAQTPAASTEGLPTFAQSFGRGVVGDNIANRFADMRGLDSAAIQAGHDRLAAENPTRHNAARALGGAALFALPFVGQKAMALRAGAGAAKALTAATRGGRVAERAGRAVRAAPKAAGTLIGTNFAASAADSLAGPPSEQWQARQQGIREARAAGDTPRMLGQEAGQFADMVGATINAANPMTGRLPQLFSQAGRAVEDPAMQFAAGVANDAPPPLRNPPTMVAAAQAQPAPQARSDAIAQQLGVSDRLLGLGGGGGGSQPAQQQAPAVMDELKEALSGLSVRQAMELARVKSQTTPAAPKPPGFRDLFGREAFNNIQMNRAAAMAAAETDAQRQQAQADYQRAITEVLTANPLFNLFEGAQ